MAVALTHAPLATPNQKSKFAPKWSHENSNTINEQQEKTVPITPLWGAHLHGPPVQRFSRRPQTRRATLPYPCLFRTFRRGFHVATRKGAAVEMVPRSTFSRWDGSGP